MQFLFGDRELLLSAKNIVEAPVDVIVNSANSDLHHNAGMPAFIVDQGGKQIAQESSLLIEQYGQIDSGMVVYTTAGNLLHQAVIHAVGPRMGDGSEQRKIEQLIARCLQLCEINEWRSIAFPPIGTGLSCVPVENCAQAFFRSVTHFWDARYDCVVNKIEICVTERNLTAFFKAFREDAIVDAAVTLPSQTDDSENEVGYIELTEKDVIDSADDEINDWFK